jgi:DNA-binding CsgD family transcriptional regulator
MVLETSDWRLLNRLLLELHGADSAVELRARTLRAVSRLAPGGWIAWSHFHPRTGTVEHGTQPAARARAGARTLAELTAAPPRSIAGHRRGWQTLAGRGKGGRAIGTVIECAGSGWLSLALHRPGGKFDRRERALLDLLHPHLDFCFQKTANTPARAVTRLSAREDEVLRWMVEGKRNGEIATILGASPRTVEKHVTEILTKLDVENRAGAIRRALESGGAGVPPPFNAASHPAGAGSS